MLNTKAILLEAESELIEQKDAVKRAVKLGIVCTILQATFETYRGISSEGNASALATQVLEMMMKNGTLRELLYEPLQIERPLEKQPEVHTASVPHRENLEEAAEKIFATLGLNPDERESLTRTLKEKLGPEGEGEVIFRTPGEIAEDELQEIQQSMGMGMPAGFGPPPSGFYEENGNLNASTS